MQEKISKGLLDNYLLKKNSVVMAVTSSGKTEISFEVIAHALNKGDRVCYCVPRKELCIELYERFLHHFYDIDIALVYGGHTRDLNKQFVVCTTHQLYRFENIGFQLVILDEADAFPFYGNDVLEAIFYNCVKGNYIKMSATIDKTEDNEQLFIMNRRYHNHDLPVPIIRIMPLFIMEIYLIYLLKKMFGKKILIFVPLINDCDKLVKHLRLLGFKVDVVNSKQENNREKIESLKKGNINIIITTTLLERGITIKDVQVIVYNSDHRVFNASTLIQIAGRVGRNKDAWDGKVYFLSSSYSKEMKRCIYSITKLNTMNV
jgi:competence protein ComFA